MCSITGQGIGGRGKGRWKQFRRMDVFGRDRSAGGVRRDNCYKYYNYIIISSYNCAYDITCCYGRRRLKPSIRAAPSAPPW